jgi:phosphoserine phosphatase
MGMLRVLLVQPGSTDFDEQGRMKGSLDIPLSARGAGQVARIVAELSEMPIDIIYTAPCRSAVQTAQALAQHRQTRVKRVKQLRNLDHGLWHGKLIDEVRQHQPKVYRLCQEHPDRICPPKGESVAAARARAGEAVARIIKRHRLGTVALVIPEPVASFVREMLDDEGPRNDFWKAETDQGNWDLIEIRPAQVPVGT